MESVSKKDNHKKMPARKYFQTGKIKRQEATSGHHRHHPAEASDFVPIQFFQAEL